MLWKFWGCLILGALLLQGCEDPKKRRPSRNSTDQSRQYLQGGNLVFSDDFDRSELGDSYKTTSARWKIVNGWVNVQNARNEGLWLKEKLPKRARIEFQARSESTDGDLKVEVFATAPKHQAGYVVIFGGWKNRINIIARLDEHGNDRKEVGAPRVEKGKAYQFAIVKTDKTLAWYLDGTLILDYPDAKPINGSYFGFNDWETDVFFDNLRIYDLD